MKKASGLSQGSAIVVGAKGNLANVLVPKVREKISDLTIVSLSSLSVQSRAERIRFWRDVSNREGEIQLIWISACTSNDVPRDELLRVNYALPVEAISTLVSNDALSRVTTFGTVLEGRGVSRNSYVESKERLSDWLTNHLDETKQRHIRTHTLVPNGPPQGHMFLGHLLRSIQESSELVVFSNGRQIREYLDLETFASYVATSTLMDSSVVGSREIVGGGKPLSLHEVVDMVREQYSSSLRVRFVTNADSEGEIFPEKPVKNSVNLAFQDSRALILRKFGGWLADI